MKKDTHPVAQFNCADHGGPLDPQEMVYWSDIPGDSSYVSPLAPPSEASEKFLTMEPDFAGWNNVRMSFETALVMSIATGRTLVLPPEQQMRNTVNGVNSQVFGFHEFFHLDAIMKENKAFKFVTMEEFLEKEGLAGRLREKHSNIIIYPPGNATYWRVPRNGIGQYFPLFEYLRSVAITPEWDATKCALGIPRSKKAGSIEELHTTFHSIMDGSYGKSTPTLEEFVDNPTKVNASIADRMREMLANRKQLCFYDKQLQQAKVIHLRADFKVRLLSHFYAFLFFADWKQDLWSKRFVRDHLRIRDEISCAAARVVGAVRDRSRNNHQQRNASSPEGLYDSMHVRRNDFEYQYRSTQLSADKLYSMSKGKLEKGSVLFIATDEKDKGFFKIFKKKGHDVVFLDDFLPLLPNTNPHLYPIIDQLIASRSRVFIGTYWSSFSGYINRLRGYHVTKNKLKGHEKGTMESWYFSNHEAMRSYQPVNGQVIWGREYPTGWRDIDHGFDELMQ